MVDNCGEIAPTLARQPHGSARRDQEPELLGLGREWSLIVKLPYSGTAWIS